MSSRELVFTNASILTTDEVLSGTVVVRDGTIVDITQDRSGAAGAIDWSGDYLLPGLVELHTDNLERHVSPRPGAQWPARAAVLAHDAELAANGITTVLDALRVGELTGEHSTASRLDEVVEAIDCARERDQLRADHFFHLRCEVGCTDAVADLGRYVDHDRLRLVSLMDHAPGQRQFVSLEKYREYFKGKYQLTEDEFADWTETALRLSVENAPRNRRAIVEMCRARACPLASHDDATREHVDQAAADGTVIAEFPTSIEAAAMSREAGMRVLMGGPNVVRGTSHSGNVAALDLAARGLLDIVSSDYVPSSLLQAAFLMPSRVPAITLPDAVAMASAIPARAVGLADRGAIEVGLRADILRVARGEPPVAVREVWRAGQRVA